MLIDGGKIGLIFSGLLRLAVLLNFSIGMMALPLRRFPTHIRYSALVRTFNVSVWIAGLTSATVAWLGIASKIFTCRLLLVDDSMISLITGLTMKETAKKPLRVAAPAASDLEEAHELL